MKHVHFEAGSGAAGDMVVAALLELGLEFGEFEAMLSRLELGDFSVALRREPRSGIMAARLEVHDHSHSGHDHAHAHAPHRHLAEMLETVERSGLPESAAARARKILITLAEAEAKVHGRSVDEVHFHEISGIDTLVDVIGACWALERLGAESVSCSPVEVGGGTVKCAHGELPVPAPATAEILAAARMPFTQSGCARELLTPTGAAILAAVCDSFGACPPLVPEAVGYGAGSLELPGRPNVLRAVLGERAAAGGSKGGEVAELRAAVDDLTPEQAAFAVERLLAAGALDAYLCPAVMKKGRPGFEFNVVCAPELRGRLEEILFAETGTLGVRYAVLPRTTLERETAEVTVRGGTVRVKLARLRGEVINVKAEYEDCAALALRVGEPLRKIQALAVEAARAAGGGKS